MNKIATTLSATTAMFLFSSAAFSSDTAAAAGVTAGGHGLDFLAAGLAVGMAALGCGLAQGRLAAAALEGMARNPAASGDIRTSMMIALAFPESLVLFSFAVAFAAMGMI